MKQEIIIKNHKLGAGKPLVCVPIVEKSREKILEAARIFAEKGVEMAEWRMDWYEGTESIENVLDVLQQLAAICKNIILLCTFRSKKQGGERELSEEAYQKLLLAIAKSGYADILDVEVFELSRPEALIKEIQDLSGLVIASEHHFFETPETAVMEEKLLAMRTMGADIGKLAVMPGKNTDVLRLLEATAQVKEQYPEYPVITMAMGGMGVISRISGQIFGSCVTFGAVGKTSAPGQLPFETVSGILENISESLEG